MKHVGVVGAGMCGLACVKSCLEEGLAVTCFEQRDNVGGLWNYEEEVKLDRASVMKSTVINSSKEMSCYSDFPMPDHFPNYAHNTKFLEYLNLYADHFKLRPHINLKTRVNKIHQVEKSLPEETGGKTLLWRMSITDLESQSTNEFDFDAVIICCGHFYARNLVKFEGQEKFKGRVLHAHDYRRGSAFEGRRVVVVGMGNSGADIACELGKVTPPVYLVVRRGSWVINRIWDNGIPTDLTRSWLTYAVARRVPSRLRNFMFERRLNQRFNQELYGTQPDSRVYDRYPTLNDDLPNRILSGEIIVKSQISRLTERGVEFSDGSKVDNVDALICATGYNFCLDLVDHPALKVKDDKLKLYKRIFSPGIARPDSLAVVGLLDLTGANIVPMELQARLAARVMSGRLKLPCRDVMIAEMERFDASMARAVKHDYPQSSIRIDLYDYSTDLAMTLVCYPNILYYLLKDPLLAYHLITGPHAPYRYRLRGPGAWPCARRAIISVMDRVKRPLLLGGRQRNQSNKYYLTLIQKTLKGAFRLCAWTMCTYNTLEIKLKYD